MTFTQAGEFYRGISNLPNIIVSIVFALKMLRSSSVNRTLWSRLFFTIGFVSILGAVAHCIYMPLPANNILWTVLMALMCYLVYLFLYLMSYNLGYTSLDRKWLYFTVICYAASMILKYAGTDYKILPYLVLGTSVIMSLIIKMIVSREDVSAEKRLLIMLAFAIFSQALSIVIGSLGTVVSHLILLISLFFLYSVAVKK